MPCLGVFHRKASAWLGLAWLGLAWLGLAWLGLALIVVLFFKSQLIFCNDLGGFNFVFYLPKD
jgi:hypothetical protein